MCPRCKKSRGGQQITFKFKLNNETVYLDATCCKVCEFLWAEDEALLKAARKHLYALTKTHAKSSPK